MIEYVDVDHSRFTRAQRDIFVVRVVPDCMTHTCRIIEEENRAEPDACCQYGADVDLHERQRILDRADELRGLLRKEVHDLDWFEPTIYVDADFPAGSFVRTSTWGKGCVFLAHDGRGCAIHRASLEGGWDFHGTKPHVCRLYPVSYDDESIVLSDDYPEYSCSQDPSAPSVYRVARADLAQIFGTELVTALDDAEAKVLSRSPGLRVVG